MTFTDEYTIVNATRDDIHAMLAFLEDDFLHNEPLNASLQLTADETRDFFIELIIAGLEDPVSYLAKSPEGEIIGIRLSTIMKRPIINDTHKNDESFEGGLFDESPSKTKSEKIHKIANFIRHLESRIWDLTPQDLDSLLNVIIVSVSKKFTGRGIARHLLQCGLDDQAKELGYQGVFTEATALISQRLFKRLGYKDLYVLEHSQWLDENGEQIFRCADGTDRGVLAFKQL